jgi:hypothetical protein
MQGYVSTLLGGVVKGASLIRLQPYSQTINLPARLERTNTLAYFILSVSDEEKNCIKLAP